MGRAVPATFPPDEGRVLDLHYAWVGFAWLQQRGFGSRESTRTNSLTNMTKTVRYLRPVLIEASFVEAKNPHFFILILPPKQTPEKKRKSKLSAVLHAIIQIPFKKKNASTKMALRRAELSTKTCGRTKVRQKNYIHASQLVDKLAPPQAPRPDAT